jgi:hypothetical protein
MRGSVVSSRGWRPRIWLNWRWLNGPPVNESDRMEGWRLREALRRSHYFTGVSLRPRLAAAHGRRFWVAPLVLERAQEKDG